MRTFANQNTKYVRDGRSPLPSDDNISKIMSSNKGKDTIPELTLRKGLWKNGLRGYRLHWNKVPGRPDIAFPGKRIAIFVNGCFWHRCPHCNLDLPKSNTEFWKQKFERNVIRDNEKLEELTNLDWRTIVVWECEISDSIEKVVERIRKIWSKC